MLVGCLRAVEEAGQFLDRTIKKGLRLKRTEGRKVNEQSLKGQIHIRMGRVLHSQGLSGGFKKIRELRV